MTEAARALWGLLLFLVLVTGAWVLFGLAVRGVYELFLLGWGLFS